MVTSAPKRHRWAPTSGEDVATNAQERVLAEESRAGAAAGDDAASPDDTLPPPPPKVPIRGLYALTPDTDDDEWLAAAVAAAIAGGASAVQYRNKTADAETRLRQARMLVKVCHSRGVPLIVNDSVDMAIATGAAGVHLGRDDDDPSRRAGGSGRTRSSACPATTSSSGRSAMRKWPTTWPSEACSGRARSRGRCGRRSSC